ncbi:MAG: hypothetical protein HFE63_06245 [Clostridiales bacterium]|nr:hypothetical protein [Clostridiales bacterium]
MKNYKSLLSRLTAFLVCISLIAIASCGSNTDDLDTVDTESDNQDTVPAVTERDRFDELGEKNFEGRVYTILDANGFPSMHVNMPEESENGDIINDALYRRDKAIEEKYNVDIQYTQITWAAEGVAALKSSVLADDDEYQLCISTLKGNALASAALEGILANLCDMDYMSLGEKWWSSLMYEDLRFNDKMYYTTGDISPVMYQTAGCLYLNMKLADDYNVTEDFPELVRSGKWTLDAVERITKDMDRDLNDDGKMDSWDDFVGFNDAYMANIFVGAGVDYSTISADGRSVEVDIVNEHTLNVIDIINKLVPNVNSRERNDKITKMFMEDRSLVLNHLVESAIIYLREMDSDYLILPMPKYDEAQENYRSYCNPWASAFIGIPRTADEEFVGFVTEALGYYSYKNVRHQTYDLLLKQKVARDEDNTEMLDYVFDNLYLDFNSLYDFGGSTSIIEAAAMGEAELASAYAEIETKVKSDIDKFVESWNGN